MRSPSAAVLLLALTACGDNLSLRVDAGVDATADARASLGFVVAPAISFPVPSAPITGRLVLETSRASRLSLKIANAARVFTIDLPELAAAHEVPVLELRAETAHTVTVTAIAEDGATAMAVVPLTVDALPAFAPTFTTTKLLPAMIQPGVTVTAIQTFVLAIDGDGACVWFVDLGRPVVDVTPLPHGRFLVLLDDRISALEIDAFGNILREWHATGRSPALAGTIGVAVDSFHHELQFLPNGDLLTLSSELESVTGFPTSEGDLTPRTTAVDVVGDVVAVFGPDGTVRARHSLLDVLDPKRVGYNSFGNFWTMFYSPANAFDWSHGNAVVPDPSDGGFVVSLRHQDALVKLDSQGAVRWILAPPDNWNAALSQKLLTPVGAFSYLFHQHAPRILPNGHVLVFDNGNGRVSPPTPVPATSYSRAVELAVDPVAMQVTQVWEFDAGGTLFAAATGDVDVASNGNIIVTFGITGTVVEVTHTAPAIEVSRIRASGALYRTIRVPTLYQ